jgi:hypothetical protein
MIQLGGKYCAMRVWSTHEIRLKMCLNEMYSKFHTGINLSDKFPIQNHLKQGDVLSPMLFNFALEYVIRKVQETRLGMKLIGAHELLGYADDINVLGDNLDIVEKRTETLTDASKEADLEVNADKSCI